MKHIKSFENHSNYQTFFEGPKFVRPNLSYCVQEKDMHYNYIIALKATYNVKDTSTPTIIANTLPTDVKELYVDGVLQQNISSSFTFSTLGEHQVKFVLKDGISAVREDAFDDCIDLSSIVMPSGITSIGPNAFNDCSGMTKIIFQNDSQLTAIGHDAFTRCYGLKSLEIPSGVTEITNGMFKGCVGITSIIIPNTVTKIGNYAFSGCSSSTSITIPNTVTSIGNEAFYGCSALLDAGTLGSVTVLNGSTFRGCTSLQNAVIPNSVTAIKNQVFQNTKLTSVNIPEGVTEIGLAAFADGPRFTSVVIPSTVTTMGNYVFRACRQLVSVTCLATTPPTLGTNAFGDNASGRKIYVPAASVNAYKEATNWSTYAADIEAIS